MFHFPLTFKFRLFTIGQQVTVTDSNGQVVCYIKQKAFRLRESVTVFRDTSQQQIVGKIEANRIIDWSARYTFTDADGRPFGAVGRQGMRSLWRSHYDIFSDHESRDSSMSIQEESVMIRVLDNLLGQVPILNFFTGFLFHPSYLIATKEGTPVARLAKKAAFFEGVFELEKRGEMTPERELEVLLSCLMMVLLERNRG